MTRERGETKYIGRQERQGSHGRQGRQGREGSQVTQVAGQTKETRETGESRYAVETRAEDTTRGDMGSWKGRRGVK